MVITNQTMLSSSSASANPLAKSSSCRSILIHSNDNTQPAQLLVVNMLHNVHIVEELTQLIITRKSLPSHVGPKILHTYIIVHYNPSVRIIDLVSHTTYVVFVNFIHKWRDLQFKVDSERQIF